jgi:hypothetical protein
MARRFVLISVLALSVLGSGCWDTFFHNTHIATRSTPINLHGFIPVPHGAPAPTSPLRIYALSDSLATISLSSPPPGTEVIPRGARGLYDWYEVRTSVTIPIDRWRKRGGIWWSYLSSDIQSAPGAAFDINVVFFEDASGANCFSMEMENNQTYQHAINNCVTRANGEVYADRK